MKLRTKRAVCAGVLVFGILLISIALWVGAGTHELFALDVANPSYAFLRPWNDLGLLVMLAGFAICVFAQAVLFFSTADEPS